eukprot:m.250053 g.250053  ORF g.250053 m.250053 type:complete len:470 (-) comp15432_c1_seq12:400-1809(-)
MCAIDEVIAQLQLQLQEQQSQQSDAAKSVQEYDALCRELQLAKDHEQALRQALFSALASLEEVEKRLLAATSKAFQTEEEVDRLKALVDQLQAQIQRNQAVMVTLTKRITMYAQTTLVQDEAEMSIGQEINMEEVRDMCWDLSDWIKQLLGIQLPSNEEFIDQLSDGRILCALANYLEDFEDETRQRIADGLDTASSTSGSKTKGTAPRKISPHCEKAMKVAPNAWKESVRSHHRIPKYGYEPPELEKQINEFVKERQVVYCPFDTQAVKGTPGAAKNLEAFITWCRTLGISDPDVFSVNDVAHQQDIRRVLYGIMDVARRTRRVRVPRLVWLERLRYMKKHKPIKDDAMDAAVWKIREESMNQPRFPIKRLGENKYMFGEDAKPVVLRMAAKNIMVRVGGGWETLPRYLESRFKADEKMEEAEANYEVMRTDYRQGPSEIRAVNGDLMNFLTTRADLELYLHDFEEAQ